MESSQPSFLLKPFLSDDGHIVATCINSGYFDYLQNMHENMKRTNVPWTLCTVCMDAEAYRKCVEHGIPAIELKSNNVHYGDSELQVYSSWNDANWNKITFMKLNAIQWLLSFSAVKSMTYTDSDIHIYRDYMPYLRGIMFDDLNTDLWIQSDHNSIKFEEHGWALCSGFFHLRNVPLVRRLFEYGEEDVQKYKFNSDQEHLVAQIRKYQVPFKQLDRALFPNGVFIGRVAPNVLERAFLIHYNYLVGADKKKKMAQNGHWYLSVLNLLRHPTNVVYPPFKQGLYLEEYFSRYNTVRNNRYMDVHWTNIQVEPRFRQIQPMVQRLVDEWYPESKNRYFTVVQHDDGVMFKLPPGTRVYAAGGNKVTDAHVPIPLIYEDQQQRLIRTPRLAFDEKDILCSFVGSMTHPARQQMHHKLATCKGFELHFTEQWTDTVSEEKQRRFVDITRRSKFCLAPRGYGRTSFRFYEAFLLGTVPIYIWDDIEWLPYREHLDYSKFAISIRASELDTLESRLNAIDAAQYEQMREAYQQVHRWFTMEGMTEYIVGKEST